MKLNVFSGVVDHDLCIGCGMCAALCPSGALTIQWNRYGEYNPTEVTPCTTECGLCLKICPFAETGENEDTIGARLYGRVAGIQHRPETGYYLASYVGYSEQHRKAGASGGMATWLLETLLTKGIVDRVICVVPTGDPDKFFAFRVFDTPEGVRSGAGSAYYPVEMSEVIRQVLEMPGRYAVIGLPCFLKAIRLAQLRNRLLRERIVVTIGLTCGQLKSRYFTDYIAILAGVQGEVKRVRYRGKSHNKPANNFYFSFHTAEGQDFRIFWNEGISEVWGNRWFTHNACNYCDDVFAECADVTFMDAWLPEYFNNPRGTSLLIARSPDILDLIKTNCDSTEISMDTIDISRVIRSQRSLVQIKNIYLAYRLHLSERNQIHFPRKRIHSSNTNILKRWEIKIISTMQKRSKQFIPNGYYRITDVNNLKSEMYWNFIQLRFIRGLNFPYRAVRYSIELLSRKLGRA